MPSHLFADELRGRIAGSPRRGSSVAASNRPSLMRAAGRRQRSCRDDDGVRVLRAHPAREPTGTTRRAMGASRGKNGARGIAGRHGTSRIVRGGRSPCVTRQRAGSLGRLRNALWFRHHASRRLGSSKHAVSASILTRWPSRIGCRSRISSLRQCPSFTRSRRAPAPSSPSRYPTSTRSCMRRRPPSCSSFAKWRSRAARRVSRIMSSPSLPGGDKWSKATGTDPM